MSLDYYLYKNLNEVLSESELESNLSDKYIISNLQTGEDDEVISFNIEPKDDPEKIFAGGLEVTLQDDGKYWIYTYDYDDNHFKKFLETIADIAEKLDFVMEDFQVGDNDIEPQKFMDNKERLKFAEMQRNMTDDLSDILSFIKDQNDK